MKMFGGFHLALLFAMLVGVSGHKSANLRVGKNIYLTSIAENVVTSSQSAASAATIMTSAPSAAPSAASANATVVTSAPSATAAKVVITATQSPTVVTTLAPSPWPSLYPTKMPTPTPSAYPTTRPSFPPTPYPTRSPTPRGPTRAPTLKPTMFPTSIIITYTDKEIFGFDVGSRTGNVVTLVSLVMVIIWLAVSTAFCITRQGNDPRLKKKKSSSKKSRRQKFEEYWGEMDASTNSTTAFNPSDSVHSDMSLQSAPPVISSPVASSSNMAFSRPEGEDSSSSSSATVQNPLQQSPLADSTFTSAPEEEPSFVADFPTIQQQENNPSEGTVDSAKL